MTLAKDTTTKMVNGLNGDNMNNDFSIKTNDTNISMKKIRSGLAIFAAIIVDTVLVFSKLQDAETGDFVLANLKDVDWISFSVVTAVCIIAAIILRIVEKNKNEEN